MGFRMKGPSMHEGTKGHKDALKLNFTMDKTSMDNGLAGSSAAQYGMAAPTKAKTDPPGKDKITWGKEKMTSETKTKNIKGGEDTKRTYETKGTSKGKKVEKYAKTPEEIAKWKAAPEKNKEKYRDKTHTKGRSETSSTEGKRPKETMVKIPPKKVKLDTKVEGKPEKVKYRKPRKKKPPVVRVVERVGDGIRNVVDNIKTARHKRKNRVGRKRRRRRTIGCGPR
jgi:hypothetical protein